MQPPFNTALLQTRPIPTDREKAVKSILRNQRTTFWAAIWSSLRAKTFRTAKSAKTQAAHI